MLGGAANHAGFSSYAVAKNPTLRWKFTAADGVHSPPVIGAHAMIYVGSADEYLYAVSPNGTRKWRYKTCGEISASLALSADGTLYAISEDGQLYAINSDDGTLKWRFSVGQSTKSSPTVGADGTVYVFCDSNLCAIGPSGSPKWRFQTHLDFVGLTQGSPAIDQTGTIYVAGSHCNEHSSVCSGELLSLNPNGTQKWRLATVGAIESSPVIGPDGSIYVVDSKRDETMGFLPSDLYAFSPQGALKWKFSAGEHSTSMPIPVVGPDGAIYAASADCNLYALNPKGVQNWAAKTCVYGYSGGDQVPSPVLDANGTIYIGSIDYGPKYTLLAIGRDGKLLWGYTIEQSHSSVPDLTSAAIGADGTIYLASNDYSLFAIGKPLNVSVPTISAVAAKVVLSPDKIDFGMATTNAQHIGTIRVTASESNKLPVTLERFSVSGDHFSLWKSDCTAGQPVYPGKFCMIDLFFSPALTTGETDQGEVVVTANALDVDPPAGRIPLIGGGKVWQPAH
ncbi:MAG: PQQ-binding-like beta-propeller repeat protein [Candidatus Binatus sp.]